jgi:hydrogenase-4 component B
MSVLRLARLIRRTGHAAGAGCAGRAVLLAAWETMALASTVLPLTEQTRRSQVRTAGLWYSVMTHLSFVLLLAGFAVLATQVGGVGFAQMATVDPRSGATSVAFLLLVLGFGRGRGDTAVP